MTHWHRMEAKRFCTTWWIANRVFIGLLLMGHLIGPGNTWAESPGRLSQMIGQQDALQVRVAGLVEAQASVDRLHGLWQQGQGDPGQGACSCHGFSLGGGRRACGGPR